MSENVEISLGDESDVNQKDPLTPREDSGSGIDEDGDEGGDEGSAEAASKREIANRKLGDTEEKDYVGLDGVGIVVSDTDNVTPLPPLSWKDTLKKYFLPDPGREKAYFIGIVIDSALFLIWITLIFTLIDANTRAQLWYMPLLGVVGGTVAMATPAGGGVFYFPALTSLQVPTDRVLAFNFAAQFTGMGLFGTYNWIRKSLSNVIFWMVGWVVLWGWIGTALSMFAFPITNEMAVRIIFAVFSFLLIIYVIVGLKRGNLKAGVGAELSPLNWKDLGGLAITGLLGGILMGWISVGIDVAIFFALTAFWGVDSRRATVTSVLVIGWTSLLPCLVHIFYHQDVPYSLWLMVIGGSLFGAKIGPLINKLLGKTVMLILFLLLLIAEVIRTFVELAILPNVQS